MVGGELTLKGNRGSNGSLVLDVTGEEKGIAALHVLGGTFNVENTILMETDTEGDQAGIVIHRGSLRAGNLLSDGVEEGIRSYTIMPGDADIEFSGDFIIKTKQFFFNMMADISGLSATRVKGSLVLNGGLNINVAKYTSDEPLVIFEYEEPADLIGVFQVLNINGREMAVDYYHTLDDGRFAVALLPKG